MVQKATTTLTLLFQQITALLPPHTVTALGGITVLMGIGGVGASARLYLAPGRPAWNSPFTIVEFYMTSALLGSAGANVLSGGSGITHTAITLAVLGKLLAGCARLVWLACSPRHEHKGTFTLLFTALANLLTVHVLLLLGSLLLLVISRNAWIDLLIALCLIGAEFVGRYLFFVSVVPSNIATEYLSVEAA
jgi:DMSO reductase anchor subunit